MKMFPAFLDSPVSPAFVAAGKRLGCVTWSPDSRHLGWLETRSGKGIVVVGDGSADAPRDLNSDISVRARVGYGGGDLTLTNEAAIYAADGQLWVQPLEYGCRSLLCAESGNGASVAVSPDGHYAIYVQSDGVMDRLMSVNLTKGASATPRVLAKGADFYMQPVWHPAGNRIAWVQWNHPNMPWDGAELHLADVSVRDDGLHINKDRVVAGGAHVMTLQPEFSPDGRMISYISDETGWSGLYVMDPDNGLSQPLLVGEFEVGVPAWSQGVRTTGWSPDCKGLYAIINDKGVMRIVYADLPSGETHPVESLAQYTFASGLTVSSRGELAFVGGSETIPNRVVTYAPATGKVRIRARSEGETLPPEILSRAEPITWQTADGSDVYGLLYRPARLPSGILPPLLVHVHGGPTGQALASYSAGNQFFTTRGFVVLEVNYRGSSGYGREYLQKLRGQWGVADAQDAMTGARYVVERGWANKDQVMIMGGSAGGLTVLQSLILYPGFYAAGLCLYGVTDLESLTRDTHKFELHYTNSLVGVLPGAQQVYRDRSPRYHADQIHDPVAIFQGADDVVVPPSQAEAIVQALQENDVPHIYHVYEGEGHGWRKFETIVAFYETALDFIAEYAMDNYAEPDPAAEGVD